MSNVEQLTTDDLELARLASEKRREVEEEIRKVIIGQQTVIDELLTALFSRGHCLLVGVPGLAKTLLIRTLAEVLHLTFNRIQFTPDLMPSDITGTEILQEDPVSRRREFVFMKGPIFCNILLADEINRTPPKTQAALLQSMQEYRVTAGGRTYDLALPFFVLATQNPIEQEGTYPLPEAQLDRFMFNIEVNYPAQSEEVDIVTRTTADYQPELNKVLDITSILKFQDLVRRVPVSEEVVNYAVNLVQSTRPGHPAAPEFIKKWVAWGAGPRASQYLVLGGKARALLHGRYAVSVEDVTALTKPVLRHRVLTNFNAEAEGIISLDIIDRLLKAKSRREIRETVT
jgi:MoxR-like ATPase